MPAMSFSGSKTPVSLFTAITLTKIVFASMAASNFSFGIFPSASGCTYTTSKPSFSSCAIVLSTAGCSIAVVTILLPARFFACAAPKIAMLSLSVPPDVK